MATMYEPVSNVAATHPAAGEGLGDHGRRTCGAGPA
jgi:hypothetical protein